jgi:glycerophosphoryl diester phosphodiesterase
MKFTPEPSQAHIEALATLLCQIIELKWPQQHPLPLISSFEWRALEIVRTKLPLVPIGFLTEHCSQTLINQVAKTPNAALHCDYLSLTTILLENAYAQAVPILAYTVNEAAIANRLFNQRIFGIFSDNPLELRT